MFSLSKEKENKEEAVKKVVMKPQNHLVTETKEGCFQEGKFGQRYEYWTEIESEAERKLSALADSRNMRNKFSPHPESVSLVPHNFYILL